MHDMIINADDLGLTSSCTQAIADAFSHGWITDTTMVANGTTFEEATKAALSELSGRVGVHFNLTEGKPLTERMRKCAFFCENERFHGHPERMKPLNLETQEAVYEELTAQLQRLRDADIDITHADSHHHIHTAPFIAPIVFRVCREGGIKAVRLHRNIGQIAGYKKIGKQLYNRRLSRKFITTDYFGSLEDALEMLPDGTTEIMVHPDYDASGCLIDREGEGRTGRPLSDITALIGGAHLTCYKELTER